MEYLIFFSVIAALLLFIFVREAISASNKSKKFELSLHENYGMLPKRDISGERMEKIKSYYNKHRSPGQIDDITWKDLGMDDVFLKMNHTYSAIGEEYLYYTLRNTVQQENSLLELEERISYFQSHEDDRVQMQMHMNDLGFLGKYSLYDYLDQLDQLGKRSNRRQTCLNGAFFALILLLFVNATYALLGMAVFMVYNIVTYFQEKSKIEPYIISFVYIMRLITAAEEVLKESLPDWEEVRRLREHVKRAKGVRKGAFLLLMQSTGNPLDIIIDYLRMVFHIDILIFNRMYTRVNQVQADIDGIIRSMGYLETVIAIGCFRASTKGAYGVPEFVDQEKEIRIEDAYHPLLEKPVNNSIATDKGVLITGSNASGKSTFLRTIAINAILAQSTHTVCARHYRAPMYRIFSSIALQDNLEGGESYYMVEIKALKRITDEAKVYDGKILCFVDEVLRGTNTVERIAASSRILKYLSGKAFTCFAATHDIELTYLLEKEYDNYHFAEEVKGGDVSFDYHVLPGRATTRNGIRLLELMGYPEEIVNDATALAEKFMKEGKWY